jgi:FkbM family methyltransferase
MALKLPSPYVLKKAVLHPRKLYMRRKENLEPGFIRSALELHYYRPTFYKWMKAVNDNKNLLHEADIDAESLVLDVGAYTGEWAQEIIDAYNPRVIAFEPDPRNYRQLAKKAQSNPHLTGYNFGLEDKNAQVRMSLEYLGSSVLSDDNDSVGVDWAEVELRDIADTWKSLQLDHVDLMKINIEGSEFPLLERMIETNLLEKVGCFMIQFHEWHPGAYSRRRKIHKVLRRTHRLVWDYHFIWEKWELK